MVNCERMAHRPRVLLRRLASGTVEATCGAMRCAVARLGADRVEVVDRSGRVTHSIKRVAQLVADAGPFASVCLVVALRALGIPVASDIVADVVEEEDGADSDAAVNLGRIVAAHPHDWVRKAQQAVAEGRVPTCTLTRRGQA